MLDSSFLKREKTVKIGWVSYKIKSLSVIDWCLLFGMANLLRECEENSKTQKKVVSDICKIGIRGIKPIKHETRMILAIHIIRFNDYTDFIQYMERSEPTKKHVMDQFWIRHIVHDVCDTYKMSFNEVITTPMGRLMAMLSEIRRAKLINELSQLQSSIEIMENGDKKQNERDRDQKNRIIKYKERVKIIDDILKDGLNIEQKIEDSDISTELRSWLAKNS